MAKTATAAAAIEQPPPERTIEIWMIALAIAGVTILGAIVVGFVAGTPAALLVVVTGALLGAILLVWYSLRTLAGDADADPALEATAPIATELDERKRRALRALKDLEAEHSIGKIDDKDYETLSSEYRERAKDVMREMDAEVEPYRAKAEALVRAHLEKRPATKPAAPATPAAPEDEAERLPCPKCETSNEPDAAFCKKCGEKLTSEA